MSPGWRRPRFYLRTLRHVRPVQVWGRLLHPVRTRLARFALGSSDVAARVSPSIPSDPGPWRDTDTVPHHDPWNHPDDLRQGRFTFLNCTASLGWPPDWQAESQSLLWRFNLHYHPYLHLLDPDERSWLSRHWVDRNPVGTEVAWHPYVLSRRIVSWVRTLRLDDRLADSLCKQVDYLYRMVEWHHPGNHLLENARALLVAACRFEEHEQAGRWAHRGARILRVGLDDQILSDGAHFERSPMYHALMFEGFVDVLRGLRTVEAPWGEDLANLRRALDDTVRRMARYLRVSTHSDGDLALLNDSTLEIAPPTARLLDYASLEAESSGGLGASSASFPDAGYFVYRDEEVYLIIDGGKIGPDHLPAHAHADIFTYEFDVEGERLVVDTGVYEYEEGPMRDHVRSTSAHNTVTVDGRDQAECWKSFRVARRFPPKDVEFRFTDEGCSFSGRFDGYGKLIGDGIVHRRSLELEAGLRRLQVSDTVDGSGAYRAVSRVHFHPECVLEPAGDSSFTVTRGDVAVRFHVEGGEPSIETGWYCPEFGLKLEKPVICLVHDGPLPARLGYTLEY